MPFDAASFNDYTLSATADRLESRIREHRLLDLQVEWQSEVVFPYYAGLSIYNLTQSIARLPGASASQPLDQEIYDAGLPTETIDRVVLFITDGLGYRLLRKIVDEDAALRETIGAITDGRGFLPLSSTAPSTTACALPTFWTAQPPAVTGMPGTTVFLREMSMLADLLEFAPPLPRMPTGWFETQGLIPQRFIPVPSLAQQLLSVGVPTHLLLGYNLTGSGLSRLLHRGIHQIHLHSGGGDVWQRMGDVLTQTAGQRACISAYLPNIDAISHLYGYDTPYVRAEISQQMNGLRAVLESSAVRDGHTLVLITADHGHYNAPRRVIFDREEPLNPVLNAMRAGLGGDERFTYLYLRDGTRAAVREVFAEHYADVAVLDGEDAIRQGLFGDTSRPDLTVHPDFANRIGDLILIPRAGMRLSPKDEMPFPVSIHAGMSSWEMMVPLLWKQI